MMRAIPKRTNQGELNGNGLQPKPLPISAKPPSEGIIKSTRGPEEHSELWPKNNPSAQRAEDNWAPT